MGIKEGFANLTKKFEKLPTGGKVAIAGGAGLLLYAIINRSSSSSSSEKQAVIYYPEATQSTLAFDTSNAENSNYINKGNGGSSGGGSFGGSSSSGNGNTGGSTNMGFNNSYMESLGDDATGSNPAGVGNINTADTFDKGYTESSYTEGGIVYKTKTFADGNTEIYKNDKLVPEQNYKYIPTAAGGTRKDYTATEYATMQTVKGSEFTDLDYELQQAQLDYGIAQKAGDTDGMAAAAALGQKLRAEGATDEGAAKAWEIYNNG